MFIVQDVFVRNSRINKKYFFPVNKQQTFYFLTDIETRSIKDCSLQLKNKKKNRLAAWRYFIH